MSKCDFNCDYCTRTLCTEGNPTIEPTEKEIAETLEELEKSISRKGNKAE